MQGILVLEAISWPPKKSPVGLLHSVRPEPTARAHGLSPRPGTNGSKEGPEVHSLAQTHPQTSTHGEKQGWRVSVL